MSIDNIPYAGTLDGAHSNPPWNMDPIHIQQLYRMCERIRPGVVVEVGSYMGASTSAFVEAMKDGYVRELICHDIAPHPSLLKVLAGAPVGRAHLFDRPYPATPRFADLILIDGDHEHGAIYDTLAAVVMGCSHVLMHDSNSVNVGQGCGGVARAVRLLRMAGNLSCHEDCVKRRDQWTHRGLFYAHHKLHESGWREGDLP